MKKNIVIAILTVALIAMGIWGYTSSGARLGYERNMEDSYTQDFEQLSDTIRDMAAKLSKCAVSNDQSFLAYTYFEVAELAAVSQDLLTRLPVSQVAIGEATKFLSRTGDFSAAMVKKFTLGEMISEDDRNSTAVLARSASAFTESIASFIEEKTGEDSDFSWMKGKREDDAFFAGAETHLFTRTLTSVDESMVDYPSMIYDGPFSDHLVNTQPKGLTGEEMSPEEIAKKIKKIYIDSGQVKMTGEVAGTIPVYVFEVAGGESSRSMYFSKKGGHLIMATSEGAPDKSILSVEQARRKAEEFLEKLGLDSMAPSYHEGYNNAVIFNYCYVQDGVKIYSDLIKVQVSLSDGKIIGYEATGFYMNHMQRSLKTASISEETAKLALNADMEVTHTSLALIPTKGKNEILCYEFKGTVGKDVYIVYIDVTSGREREIFQVIEADDSILVL